MLTGRLKSPLHVGRCFPGNHLRSVQRTLKERWNPLYGPSVCALPMCSENAGLPPRAQPSCNSKRRSMRSIRATSWSVCACCSTISPYMCARSTPHTRNRQFQVAHAGLDSGKALGMFVLCCTNRAEVLKYETFDVVGHGPLPVVLIVFIIGDGNLPCGQGYRWDARTIAQFAPAPVRS